MIQVNGTRLPLGDIEAVALKREPVMFTEAAIARLRHSYEAAAAAVQRRPVYGRTTGVGANRSVSLDGADSAQGLNLLRSHAADSGSVVDDETVRAMLVVRASQLAAGGSGIDPAIPAALLDLLNENVLPEVRVFGGIGTGDLPALAGTALTLLGERAPKAGILRRPLQGWKVDDALPFISSNALTIAQAALAARRVRVLLSNLVVTGALSSLALRGNREAWSAPVTAAMTGPYSADAAQALTALTEGTKAPARIQDPYCLRALPQSLGSQFEELVALEELVEKLAAGTLENPLVHWGRDGAGSGDVSHNGLFHAMNLAQRVDGVGVAVGAATALTLRRISLLNDPAYTGLERFLASAGNGASGVMMLEYVAAAATGRIRANAHPASLQTVVLSLGAEEDASFANLAVEQLTSTALALRTLVGVEFLCATRALRLQGASADSFGHPAVRTVLAERFARPYDAGDRDLRNELQEAEELVSATPLAGGSLDQHSLSGVDIGGSGG